MTEDEIADKLPMWRYLSRALSGDSYLSIMTDVYLDALKIEIDEIYDTHIQELEKEIISLQTEYMIDKVRRLLWKIKNKQ